MNAQPVNHLLDYAGRLFTLSRIILGVLMAGGTAWAVSFFVADYVSKASVEGLSTAVINLQENINSLSENIRQLDKQMMEVQQSREALAIDIANRVGELRVTDAGQAGDLKIIREGVDQLKESVERIENRMIPDQIGQSGPLVVMPPFARPNR